MSPNWTRWPAITGQGRFRKKERFYEAVKRFCRFLANHYRLQNLANINGKHLAAYVLHLQEREESTSIIKTDLASIHFFHDKLERIKYRLPSNDEINESIAIELKKMLAVTEWRHKLFVSNDIPTDLAIHRLQRYIYKVRPQI